MHNSVRCLNDGYVLHRSVKFMTKMTVILEGGKAKLSARLHSCVLHWLACPPQKAKYETASFWVAKNRHVQYRYGTWKERDLKSRTTKYWTILKVLIIQRILERFLRHHHLSKQKFLLSILRLQTFRRNTEVYEQSWCRTTGELEKRSVRMDRLNTFLKNFEPA
jgi:hypothetical protein